MSTGTAAFEEVLEADLKRQSHHHGPHHSQCLGCAHLWIHLQPHEALTDRYTRQTRPSSGDLASHLLLCNPLHYTTKHEPDLPLLPFLLNSLTHARHSLIHPSRLLADVGNGST